MCMQPYMQTSGYGTWESVTLIEWGSLLQILWIFHLNPSPSLLGATSSGGNLSLHPKVMNFVGKLHVLVHHPFQSWSSEASLISRHIYIIHLPLYTYITTNGLRRTRLGGEKRHPKMPNAFPNRNDHWTGDALGGCPLGPRTNPAICQAPPQSYNVLEPQSWGQGAKALPLSWGRVRCRGFHEDGCSNGDWPWFMRATSWWFIFCWFMMAISMNIW